MAREVAQRVALMHCFGNRRLNFYCKLKCTSTATLNLVQIFLKTRVLKECGLNGPLRNIFFF